MNKFEIKECKEKPPTFKAVQWNGADCYDVANLFLEIFDCNICIDHIFINENGDILLNDILQTFFNYPNQKIKILKRMIGLLCEMDMQEYIVTNYLI